MPRGFNEREKDAIRANLLDAGRAKLIAVGMGKTSVEELARAAHISKGAFYQFFPSKEALFMALFAEAEHSYRDQLRAFAARPGRTPKARMLAFLRDALRRYREAPLLNKVSRDDMAALLRVMSLDGARGHQRRRSLRGGNPWHLPRDRTESALQAVGTVIADADDLSDRPGRAGTRPGLRPIR
jgi:AcrR family transcriptional regulator